MVSGALQESMGLLIAFSSLAAAVWTVPTIRSGRVIPFATLVLAIGTVFGPLFCLIDGPIGISFDRIAMVVLFAVIAVRWRMGQLKIAPIARTDCLLVGIAIWLLIRALGAEDRAGIGQWLTFVAMPAAMYAVTRLVEVRDRDIRWFCNGVVFLGCYLALTAVLEITGFHSLVFPHYIADPEYSQYFGRGRGPLLNPTGNGILMTMALVASLLGFIRADRLGKLLYAATTLVLVAGIYATLTRSVWMGALLAVSLIALVFLPRWARVLGLAFAVLLGGAAASGLKDNVMRIKRDKDVTAADAEKSVQLRPLLVVVAYEMFRDRPITGHGYGRYSETSIPYHAVRDYGLPLDDVRHYIQHNVLLSILVDTGLIGLGLLVLWLAMASVIGWKLARDRERGFESQMLGLVLIGLLAAYLCNGMFHDVSVIPMMNMILFFTGGLALTRFATPKHQSAG